MKNVILSALLGLAVIVSCEKKNETATTENSEMHAEHAESEKNAAEAAEKSDDHDESAELTLDNGKKWVVNEEMKPYVAEMEDQLEQYKPESGDYKLLAANLIASNDNLVKSCTMTGKSHDVLHVWLTDHIKELKKLQKAPNREEANDTVKELKESMAEYHEYFN
ncbi:hypothetical protein EGI11_03940 [Chryseobacterium sp. H3056]|uniref:Lipoprotein n=1 Tax=Kaistella daneshvariae TaxID=2487074 RepID=A0A3N0WXU6_9FLAO|nr:hypothetical protein [Kaistella daneshvariae]ROI09916.1 hypothetical protein EGI11_03940 [Kaistella daneshvariae]